MARKPPSIAEQVRAALKSIFGRKRAKRAAPARKKPGRRVKRPKRVTPPPPRQKICGVCGESGHNARRHRSEIRADPPVEPQVLGELPGAAPPPPDAPAAPAEGEGAEGAAEAAGGLAGDIEGAPAGFAAPDAGGSRDRHGDDTSSFLASNEDGKQEQKRRGPRHCKACGELGHDRRTCPVPPPVQRPDIPPKPPTLTGEHRQEPENIEEEPADFTRSDQPGRTSVGRGRGRRHCRRCGQAGHNINGCDLDESDLAAARLQDIAAACVRIGLTPAPPPRAPLPVREQEPATPIVVLPTWDREDLDAIAAMMPDLPEPPAPAPPPPETEPASVVAPAPLDEMDQQIAAAGETGLDRARRRLRVVDGRARGRTVPSKHLTNGERKLTEILVAPEDIVRPLERGDCEADDERPCPWVSCPHNNYLDVNPETGSIKFNHPHLEPWQMTAKNSCSLDVAERGGITLEDVGEIIGLTRERIRQVEVRGLEAIKRYSEKHRLDLEMLPERESSALATAIG